MPIDSKRDLTAIGPLACQLGATVRRIEGAAESLGMPPAMRLSGVPYYDADQVEQLRQTLSQKGTSRV